MNKYTCLIGTLICTLTLLIIGSAKVHAAEGDPNLVLRPHCKEGYGGDEWIFGDIAPPGWNTAEDSSLCAPFNIEDPQTLRTPVLQAGDTLDLDLVVQNPNGLPISSVRTWLNYDPNILEGVEIIVQENSFTETTPGEVDFASEEGYIKINVSIPKKDALSSYWVPVAKITLVAKKAIDPGSIINFYDAHKNGHTYILSQGTTGKEHSVLGQDPGSLFVRISSGSTEILNTTEVSSNNTESLTACSANDECPSNICYQLFCRSEEFKIPNGGECNTDSQCLTGLCTHNICTALSGFSDGLSCAQNEECASGICSDGFCSTSTTTVPNENVPCTDDIQCGSGENCIEGMCKELEIIKSVGEACIFSNQCETRLCVEGMCKDPETHKNDRTAFSLLQLRNVRVTTEGSSAFLQWDDLRSSSLKTYNIYYGTTSGEYIQRKIVPGTTPSVTIRNLPENTTYYFAVRSANANDEETAFSQEVAVEIGNPSTSTAPLVAALFTDAPRQNPIGDTAVEVPGETGSSSVIVMLVLLSAVIGTILASRRQIIASTPSL